MVLLLLWFLLTNWKCLKKIDFFPHLLAEVEEEAGPVPSDDDIWWGTIQMHLYFVLPLWTVMKGHWNPQNWRWHHLNWYTMGLGWVSKDWDLKKKPWYSLSHTPPIQYSLTYPQLHVIGEVRSKSLFPINHIVLPMSLYEEMETSEWVAMNLVTLNQSTSSFSAE